MATQSADGYIGTYPDSCHLGDWDIWGRKYVLLGLLAYYDQTKETVALEAARRVADHLIAEAGPGSGTNIAATGWIGWKGLASCSVLEPITLLYQRTGEKRYLDFARHIVRSWDEPNRLAPAGLRLIQEAIGETAPWKMSGAPKAYEMMSCFEGLCELYRVTAEPLYLEAVQRLVDALVRDEIMIAGSGSVAEIWCHGAVRQSEPLYQGMETCVTATWMKLMYQMLRLTGDSPLRRPARDEPVQRVARGHVAPRRVVGLLQRPDGRAGAQPPAVPRRGDELLRGQRSSRTNDHALMGRHDRARTA